MSLTEDLEAAAERITARALPAVVGVGNRWQWGSGFVFQDGLVVTNAHNVRGESSHLRFADGARRESTATHLDQGGDLALLEVDTAGAPSLTWAPAPARLGTPVFAVAQPLGQGPELSFGVVSSPEREFRGPGGRPIAGGFQHTAPLPHGASGGPVLDLEGRLLGIDTKRRAEGFYAAISADPRLRARIEALSRGERVVRPYLGVGLLPGEAARRLRGAVGLEERDGVLVQHLDEEGPAAKAGLRRGDLIATARGVALSSASDLHRLLAGCAVGEELELQLVRGAEELTLSVTLGEEPESPGHQHRRGPRH